MTDGIWLSMMLPKLALAHWDAPEKITRQFIPDETYAIIWTESNSLSPSEKDEALKTDSAIEVFINLK